MSQYMCYVFLGRNYRSDLEGKAFPFFLTLISHASSSIVANNFSSAKEQNSDNEAQLQSLATHVLSIDLHEMLALVQG